PAHAHPPPRPRFDFERSGVSRGSQVFRRFLSNLSLPPVPLGERANTVIHAVGVSLSAVGGSMLVVMAALGRDAWKIAGCSIYAATLVALYLVSTLYHWAAEPRRKRMLRTCDHIAIYFLIAGTYSPFLLVNLAGAWGWTLFAAVWSIALIGIPFKLCIGARFNFLSTLIYLAMGWLALVATKPVLARVPPGGIALLVAGGIAYTVGTVFYLSRSIRHAHAIWHGFVVGGSVCHYFAVMFYVLPFVPAAG